MKHLMVWPKWLPAQYNGCNDPCDMVDGPCACGATHRAEELSFAGLTGPEIFDITLKLEEKIQRVQKLVGTQTDCQCQGEPDCKWCQIRKILES